MSISSEIKKRRLDLNLTQTKLAELSQVSLPTIQNIEANKANPSLDILIKIFETLGFDLIITNKKADLNILGSCGLPIYQTVEFGPAPNKDLLLSELIKLMRDQALENEQRLKDAVLGLLLAIKFHYPSTFKSNFNLDVINNFLSKNQIDGKVLKLKRISLTRLGTYL